MASHVTDDLPRLLSGEAPREDVLAAAAHLRTCEDCQQELVSAVVAHASLTSAQRFAPEVARRGETVLAQPPAQPLPDLTAVFAQVRAEAESAATDEAPPSRLSRFSRFSRQRLLVAAAVTGLLAGGAAAATVALTGSGPSARTIALDAYGAGHSPATARLSGTRLTVDASTLPTLDGAHRYEVWLTNAARTAMQPVGWVATDGRATLTMPPNLMQAYSALEVSVQQVDAPTYTYSGTSVLRGSY